MSRFWVYLKLLVLRLEEEEEQQFFLVVSSRILSAEVCTSTSSLAHISLASITNESRMFLPSLELVSIKIALYSLAIFSPSSAPTHLLPVACPAVLWSTLFPHRMIGILFSDTSSILLTQCLTAVKDLSLVTS